MIQFGRHSIALMTIFQQGLLLCPYLSARVQPVNDFETLLSLLHWDLSCRKEYVKAFVDKEAGEHAVDAAA